MLDLCGKVIVDEEELEIEIHQLSVDFVDSILIKKPLKRCLFLSILIDFQILLHFVGFFSYLRFYQICQFVNSDDFDDFSFNFS